MNKFKYIGANWNQSLNGQLITPSALGYNPGDTITFRTIIVCRKIFYDPNMMQWSLLLHFRERDLRIVVVADQCPMPKLSNWYLADCHTHSWNTDDEFEYGGVTPFMVKAAKKIGLDCVIFTDHSNDCGWVQDHNDGWGSGTNWNHCGWEIDQYTDALLIRGEEISAHRNGVGWGWVTYPPFYVKPSKIKRHERHFLGFGLNSFIKGWHPLVVGYPGALYDVNGILSGYPPPQWTWNYGTPSNHIKAQGGFGYYAHPGDYFEEEDDSTTLIEALEHNVCKGWQIFNCRKTHRAGEDSGGDEHFHPWGEFPYGKTWETSRPDWLEIYVPIIRIWDRYMSQHLNSFRKKALILGGSDAHGDFNYSIGKQLVLGWQWPPVDFDWIADATALGAWRTAVYCPGGLTRDNILNGLKNGRTVVTDGAVMIFGIDMNNDGDIYDAVDLMIGDGDNNEDGAIDHKARLFGACKDSGMTVVNPTSYINFMFEWQSNSLFGPVDSIILYQGTSTTGDHPDRVCKLIPSNGQQGTMNYEYYWASRDSATIDTLFIYDDDEDPNKGLVNFNYFATWGEIEPGTVWQGIVNIGGDVVIPENVTLTIEPETEIRFAARIDGAQGGIDTTKTEMIVFGEIEIGEQKNGEKRRTGETEIGRPNECQMTNDDLYGAKAPTPELSNYRTMGSSNHKIYFTSDAFEPAPGDWYGIRFVNGLEREIDNWVIEHATCCLDMPMTEKLELKNSNIIGASQYGLLFGGEEVEIKSCSLSANCVGLKIETEEFEIKESWLVGNDTGMVISAVSGEVKENIVKDNAIGIYLRGEISDLQIGSCNEFDHNFGYHIYNDTPNSIDATENYWYPAEPESIAFYIYDYYDDPNLGVVWFEPIAGGFAGGPQGYSDAQLEKIKVSFGSNPTTHFAINYSLPSTQNVDISVYDVTGRLVSRENEKKEKGIYNLAINNLPSGVYFVKFKASDFEIEKKVIFLK